LREGVTIQASAESIIQRRIWAVLVLVVIFNVEILPSLFAAFAYFCVRFSTG